MLCRNQGGRHATKHPPILGPSGRAENRRVFGSVAAALIAAQHGAHILRVHDVAATRDALEVLQAVRANSA